MGAWWIKNYDQAKAYLDGGRKKYDRPMYMRGLRLQTRGNDIAIRDKWGNFDPILFHPDGSLTLQSPISVTSWGGTWNPMWSQGVRYTMTQFSGLANVYQKDRKIWLLEQDAVCTPSKIQRCRSCKGWGKVDGWCSTQTCRNPYPCQDHPNYSKPNNRYWHDLPCVHGHDKSHSMQRSQDCYSCGGAGKRDYGNKPIATEWDGSPIRIRDGKFVKKEPTELERQIANYVAAIV